MANRKPSVTKCLRDAGHPGLDGLDLPRVCPDPPATRRLGRAIAGRLGRGAVLVLTGPLGAGKTEFVAGMAEGLGIDRTAVASPSFTVVHEYASEPLPLFHFDFYRLEREEEALVLGLEEYFSDGISVVEWGERFPELLPAGALQLRIDPREDGSRLVRLGEGW